MPSVPPHEREPLTTAPSLSHQVLEDVLGAFPDVLSLAVVDDGELVSVGVVPVAERARLAVSELFRVADEAAVELKERAVEQLVVDTPDGAVVGLREGTRLVVAITAPHPSSIGLLFYDLRRRLAAAAADEPAGSAGGPA